MSVWPLSQPSPSFQLDAAALFAQATDIAQGVCLKILSAAPGGFSGTSHLAPEVSAGRDARFAACVDAAPQGRTCYPCPKHTAALQERCLTTVLLQAFVNNVRVAEDIPSALRQVQQQ